MISPRATTDHEAVIYRGGLNAHGANEGYGTLIDADTGFTLYDGEWHESQRDGYGIELSNGEIAYEGFWLKDQRHGLGVAYDGHYGRIVFQGLWVDDKPHYESLYVSNVFDSVSERPPEQTVHMMMYSLGLATLANESERASCANTCRTLDSVSLDNDGVCDDGGFGPMFHLCPIGADCADCGLRFTKPELLQRHIVIIHSWFDDVMPMFSVLFLMLVWSALCIGGSRPRNRVKPMEETSTKARATSIRMTWTNRRQKGMKTSELPCSR